MSSKKGHTTRRRRARASVAFCALTGCATFHGSPSATREPGTDDADFAPTRVDMPAVAASVRDDPSAPIVTLSSVGQAVFPYVYGYPLYPIGEEARGITKLRRENWDGARQAEVDDDAGVRHASEELPKLGCRFDGFRESAIKFQPISLTCEVPAPKALGGAQRPVLGTLFAFTKAEELLREPSIEQSFLGEFHLTSKDFASGSGTGYFNTAHGQLAFVYAQKKLVRFVYYFDPDVAGWQNQELWLRPS